MATLKFFTDFDLDTGGTWLWKPTSIAANSITFETNGYVLSVSGTFTLVGDGISGGTVSALSLGQRAAPAAPGDVATDHVALIYTMTGLSFDAVALVQQITNATPQQAYGFLLSGNDTITGADTGGTLHGYAGADTITGGAGRDFISGGAGNDVIDGGGGIDDAAYGGLFADYKIENVEGGLSVTALHGTDGTDMLKNIEALEFSDKLVALVDVNAISCEVFRLYRAALDRTPDATGLYFWSVQLSNGLKLEAIADGFIKSAEYQQLYGAGVSNHDLVSQYYEHILHRAPEQAGLDFWSGVLDSHAATNAQVLAAISESAENVQISAEIIGKGLMLIEPLIQT